VGIVVSRKVGKAVVRNRVRRRLKEALRELLKAGVATNATLHSRPSFDLLVIARPSAATADYHELKRSMRSALARAALIA